MEGYQKGRSEQPGALTRFLKDGSKHGRRAALAVCSCNMDEFKLLLWVAEGIAQRADAVQPRFAGKTPAGVDAVSGRHRKSAALPTRMPGRRVRSAHPAFCTPPH